MKEKTQSKKHGAKGGKADIPKLGVERSDVDKNREIQRSQRQGGGTGKHVTTG